ncbi:MAG: sigma-70 family RNA polymerase sigma factor [Limnochordia bacterium]|jgi:RNA polymerase sigma-70 factor (ECF subfamily)|nr:sigma-70 family RNA polymerase sigma factor [Limnochordia bacterium]
MDISRALIRRCKKNDKAALNELLRQYEQYLYKICYYYCQDKDEAFDICQEVYIRIFRHMASLDEDRPIVPWLKRLAVNTCLNYKRDHRKVVPVSLDGNPALMQGVTTSDSVEEIAMSHNDENVLSSALASLADNQRMALTLRYVEDLSYEEIAHTMELPLGTVKSHIFRGRNALREILRTSDLVEG